MTTPVRGPATTGVDESSLAADYTEAVVPQSARRSTRGALLQVYRREVPDSGGPGRYRGGVSIEFAAAVHKAGGVATFNSTERRQGKTIIQVRS